MSDVKETSVDSSWDDPGRVGEDLAVTWTHPKRNLWVASRSGKRAGSVELVAEHFVSCDEVGRHRATHPDLRLAQQAVENDLSRQPD